jgi:hypothetical protein
LNMPFKLSMYITSMNSLPAFVTPVFECENKLWLQVIGEDDVVTDFNPVELPKSAQELVIWSEKHRLVEQGGGALYAFAWTKDDVSAGTKGELIRELSGEFRRLSKYPYIGLEVARFIGSLELMNDQIDVIAKRLSKSDTSLALEWRRFQRQLAEKASQVDPITEGFLDEVRASDIMAEVGGKGNEKSEKSIRGAAMPQV